MQFNWLEIAGTLSGLVYLYLEYRANTWLWVVSIIMPALYLGVYWDAGLYADFGISIYYIIASVYGLICWLLSRRDNVEGGEAGNGITRIPRKLILILAICFVALWAVIGGLLMNFTDSNVPWADGFTTSLSIVAMWMLAKKYLEQWLVWIVANVGCAVLYLYKGLYLTSGLYLLYAVIAWFGYKEWKNENEL